MTRLFYTLVFILGGYCFVGSLPRMLHIVPMSKEIGVLYSADVAAMAVFIVLYTLMIASIGNKQ